MTQTRRITQSELKDFRRCGRKWWLAWFRRLRLDPALYTPNAASQGTVVHECLRSLYVPGENWRVRLQAWQEDGEEKYAESPVKLDKFQKQVVLAEIMVEGYEDWLVEEGMDSEIEVIANEQEVEAPFMPGVSLLGKLDMRIHDRYDDMESFLDFKTVGSMDQIPNRANIDEQFLHYATILQLATDRSVPGGMWRMLRKVKRTARATPPFYGQHRVRYSSAQMDSYRARLTGMIERILRTEAELESGRDPLYIVPPNPTDSCRWDCQFREICPSFDDGSRVEEFIADYYVQGDPLDRYADVEEEE